MVMSSLLLLSSLAGASSFADSSFAGAAVGAASSLAGAEELPLQAVRANPKTNRLRTSKIKTDFLEGFILLLLGDLNVEIGCKRLKQLHVS